MLLALPYQPHILISLMVGHPFDHKGKKKPKSWIASALDPKGLGRTMSGEMTGEDIGKFHEGTLPPLDYGYGGYSEKFRALPVLSIHIPGLDSDSDRAYNDRSESS
jgi:hypothetical protein